MSLLGDVVKHVLLEQGHTHTSIFFLVFLLQDTGTCHPLESRSFENLSGSSATQNISNATKPAR
jgi:hypothetical protein